MFFVLNDTIEVIYSYEITYRYENLMCTAFPFIDFPQKHVNNN